LARQEAAVTDVEFRDWLQAEVLAGRMTPRQRDDLLEQKDLFDQARAEIEHLYPHRVVGYVSGERHVGGSLHELLAQARQSHPGRMVYFEPVGFELC
jgi:hypothetical protein